VARGASDRNRPPLDAAALDRLAIDYVARYATTRAKVRTYLQRKITERGWSGEGAPPLEAIVARLAELGFVDDKAFAVARSASLGRRGYGAHRVGVALRAAGIAADDAAPALEGTPGALPRRSPSGAESARSPWPPLIRTSAGRRSRPCSGPVIPCRLHVLLSMPRPAKYPNGTVERSAKNLRRALPLC
jgi:Fe2+ transport system protein FeoA